MRVNTKKKHTIWQLPWHFIWMFESNKQLNSNFDS